MSSNLWVAKYNIINDINDELGNQKLNPERFHYTSLPVLFSILDADSFWISNVRFSNDSTEERLMEEKCDLRDDYIFCLSDSGDQLSQWRGYCHNGGAAIEFNMRGLLDYSILHADYEKSMLYELYENLPMPVIYIENTRGEMRYILENIETRVQKWPDLNANDIIPFLKNISFQEEREARLLFVNQEERLSKCIRFRTLANGVKVPYMIVKQGDIGKMYGSNTSNVAEYTPEKLSELADTRQEIWIEEGKEQEKIYLELTKKIDEFCEKNPTKNRIEVYCKGHLPVKSIIVAPTYDGERLAEQIHRFCESKYWLRGVSVKRSKIPYVQQG